MWTPCFPWSSSTRCCVWQCCSHCWPRILRVPLLVSTVCIWQRASKVMKNRLTRTLSRSIFAIDISKSCFGRAKAAQGCLSMCQWVYFCWKITYGRTIHINAKNAGSRSLWVFWHPELQPARGVEPWGAEVVVTLVSLLLQEDLGRNCAMYFNLSALSFFSGASVGRFFRLLWNLRSLGTSQFLQSVGFFCMASYVFE